MKKITTSAILLSVFLFSLIAQANCSKKEAIEAESSIANLKSWNDLYSSYTKYSQCDDGTIAEGYSESVTQLFINRWELLDQLESFTKKDKKFEIFVVKHIDRTASEDTVDKILKNTLKHCPIKNVNICNKISKSIRGL